MIQPNEPAIFHTMWLRTRISTGPDSLEAVAEGLSKNHAESTFRGKQFPRVFRNSG
jgi:hypothetical protein